MKKKYIIITISIICIFSLVIMSVNSYIQFSLTFSDGTYSVYVPDGAPDEIHLSTDVFYLTSRMSFDYANDFLLNNDYEQFETVFFECYNKFSYHDNIYLSMKKIFLDKNNNYSNEQENVLITCFEKIYEIEVSKGNVFLAKKNLLLRIELNREFGNITQAFSLLKKAEETGVV